GDGYTTACRPSWDRSPAPAAPSPGRWPAAPARRPAPDPDPDTAYRQPSAHPTLPGLHPDPGCAFPARRAGTLDLGSARTRSRRWALGVGRWNRRHRPPTPNAQRLTPDPRASTSRRT